MYFLERVHKLEEGTNLILILKLVMIHYEKIEFDKHY